MGLILMKKECTFVTTIHVHDTTCTCVYIFSITCTCRKASRGCRQGYMGHLIRLANQLSGNSPNVMNSNSFTRSIKQPEENRLQEELDEDTLKQWTDFISGPVMDMNKKNSTNLVRLDWHLLHPFD